MSDTEPTPNPDAYRNRGTRPKPDHITAARVRADLNAASPRTTATLAMGHYVTLDRACADLLEQHAAGAVNLTDTPSLQRLVELTLNVDVLDNTPGATR